MIIFGSALPIPVVVVVVIIAVVVEAKNNYFKKKKIDGKPGWQWQRICLRIQETRLQSLGREVLLEKEMATHFSVLAWRIPWIEEPGGLQAMEWQRVRHD